MEANVSAFSADLYALDGPLKNLTAQQELVLRLRFGQGPPATIQQVADALGLPVQTARRIEDEALRGLRLSALDPVGSGQCDWDEV
jgi:DNA-directed RNA polymerase sigma subunit (sigma70/sigma32)